MLVSDMYMYMYIDCMLHVCVCTCTCTAVQVHLLSIYMYSTHVHSLCLTFSLSLSPPLSLSLSLSPPLSSSPLLPPSWPFPSLFSISSLFLSLSSQDTCTLKSKFEVSSGPTSPTPALVHFMCDGSTLSGVAMAIESSAYKISLQKNKCFSGKDIIIVSLVLLFIAVFVTINSNFFV